VTPLPGARDLLRRVADLGLQVVLASSAPDDELDILRKVLSCDDVIAETTSSRDVDTAKPDPGIVQVAVDRAGVTPEQAVFVGDAVWDAHAAAAAGLPCIGLLSGGISEAELHAAVRRRSSPIRRTYSITWTPPASRRWQPPLTSSRLTQPGCHAAAAAGLARTP
jgi:phosphoglycolate phosphatase-like HAD superfamily hydrolase